MSSSSSAVLPPHYAFLVLLHWLHTQLQGCCCRILPPTCRCFAAAAVWRHPSSSSRSGVSWSVLMHTSSRQPGLLWRVLQMAAGSTAMLVACPPLQGPPAVPGLLLLLAAAVAVLGLL
jgi:hypothetical protein